MCEIEENDHFTLAYASNFRDKICDSPYTYDMSFVNKILKYILQDLLNE